MARRRALWAAAAAAAVIAALAGLLPPALPRLDDRLPAAARLALLGLLTDGAGVTVRTGIPHGPHPRQLHDLYLPSRPGRDGALILFLHGGGWDSGSPEQYRFVGLSLARMGHHVAVAGYRLFPEVTFPAFVADAAAAVAALRASFPDLPLVLMGHSAGAHVAALLALDPRHLAARGLDICADLAGLIGLAGPYDPLPMFGMARFAPIFPEARRADARPLAFAAGRHPPALLLHGADDAVVPPGESLALAEALRRAGNRARAVIHPGVGHFGILAAIAPVLAHRAPVRRDIARFLAGEAAPGCPPSPARPDQPGAPRDRR
ncbi:MAG: alpha/beta hydrolase [Alphaproteobacteria bacterium]|nr:MAG: alpha/beta hydrolase [Alphaproteobacteria bacterium]